MAYRLAPYIPLQRKEGNQCLVPLTVPNKGGPSNEFNKTTSGLVRLGVMILPKTELSRKRFPPALLFRELDQVWNALSEAERERIRADGFALDEHTGGRFTELGRKLTSYPFAYAADDDSLIAEYLTWYRRKIYSYSKERYRPELNLGICEAVRNGLTCREVAQICDLKPTSVGAVKRQADDSQVLVGWREIVYTIPKDDAELARFVIDRHFRQSVKSLTTLDCVAFGLLVVGV